MSTSIFDRAQINFALLQNAATDPTHAVRKQEFDAAIEELSGIGHAPVTKQDSSSVAISLAGQQITAEVRLKASPTTGEGGITATEDGLVVDLGTGANEAAAGNHGHSAATSGAAGFMSAADKSKLDGVAAGATAMALAGSGSAGTAAKSDHTHSAVTESTPGFMTSAMLAALTAAAAIADGLEDTIESTVEAFLASTASVDITSGVGTLKFDVRRKTAGLGANEGLIVETADGLAFRIGTGANEAAAGNHVHNAATESAAGFLSAADKAKLDALSATEFWLPAVTTKSGLPLNTDPVDAVRLVRDEERLYRCIANVGLVDDQWEALPDGASSGMSFTTIGGNATAVAGNRYALDTTSGVLSLTLPPSPAPGQMIEVFDAQGTWGTNNATLIPGSQLIEGVNQNLTCDVPDCIMLRYVGGAKGWRVT